MFSEKAPKDVQAITPPLPGQVPAISGQVRRPRLAPAKSADNPRIHSGFALHRRTNGGTGTERKRGGDGKEPPFPPACTVNCRWLLKIIESHTILVDII